MILLGYTVYNLINVGNEIETIQKVDLPALERLSNLLNEELHRHIVGNRLYNARLDSLGSKQIEHIENEYYKYSDRIDNAIDAPQTEADSLRWLLNKKFGSDKNEFLEKLSELQNATREHATKLAAPSSSLSEVEDAWNELDRLLERIDQKLESAAEEVLQESRVDAAKLAQNEKRLIWIIIIATLIVVAIALVAIRKVIVNITAPLEQITEASTRISKGDLTFDNLNIHTGDELSVLANAFNNMQTRLRTQIIEIQSSVETLGASIQQTSASIEEQASSVKEEAATVQEITTTMQEIQQSGVEIAQRAGEVAQNSEENLKVSEDGLEAVENTSSSMGLIREQVEEVAEKIVNLSEKTQAIGDIVSTVNEIAEQSNILAINASIEASDAGEKGSRFSIVAQEMKGLADQAKENTRQVRGILGDIQKGINTSVMLTEEAVKRSEAGKQHSEITDSKIRNLLESTHGNMQAFRQIIAGTNQQQIGIDQITQGMQDIRQAGQQTVVGISELEQATSNLKAMSSQLKAILQQYKV